ncbi:MAG: hypothetical protein JEZ06_17160 [Anaerolineaceae bacterium]|nr:hypothetical protein [Anaerolineaceae bacterium]
MNHQPYENWIYSEADLTRDQQIKLNQHISDCNKCRQKQLAWQSVRRSMVNLPVIPPKSNFVLRWKKALPNRIKQKQENQVRLFFILLFGFSFLISALLVTILGVTHSPIGWITNTLNTLTEITLLWKQISNSIVLMANTIPRQMIRTLWIVSTSIVSVLALFWFGALWKIMKREPQGVHTK